MSKSQPKRRGYKISLHKYIEKWKFSTSKIYKDIHQSRVGPVNMEASSGPRTEEVPTNNQRGRSKITV